MPSIKRKLNGAAVSSPRSNQRLSQASLQKAFFSMLACVSILYFLLIFLFFRRHDLKIYRDRGGFNHSIRSNTAEAWKQHLEKLAREQDERQRLREQVVPVQSHSSDHKDLEQPDIEEMIRPELIRERKDGTNMSKSTSIQSKPAMTAFVSSKIFDNSLDAGSLTEIGFPTISSCSNFRESVENKVLEDPFLPKLISVVALSDGSHIQIAAQNSIQCRNETDASTIKRMHLQAALFQPVSVKRTEIDGETKYQVISNQDENQNVVSTRFLCRFEPTGQETLSSFSQQNDTNEISESDANLFFQCPVPNDLIPSLKQKIKDHSEQPDFTLTLVPFRTPPYAQSQEDAMPPCYLKPENEDSSKLRRQLKSEADFLPKISDAARWENVPICLSDNSKTA